MSAYFPLGMKTQPFAVQYVTTKGTGENAYPVGVTSGNQRPLTNKEQHVPKSGLTERDLMNASVCNSLTRHLCVN